MPKVNNKNTRKTLIMSTSTFNFNLFNLINLFNLFNFSNGNTAKASETCQKLTIKTPEQRQ